MIIMKYKSFLILCLIEALFVYSVIGQKETNTRNWTLNGYLSSLQSVIVMDSMSDNWEADYLLHNRLNFDWSPSRNFSLIIEMRNRFMYGDQLKSDTLGYYKNSLENDKGIADLAWNIGEGKSYVFNVMVDRIYARYTYKKFEATIGRQRINWGQTFVWNPNDIFNTYSFFDFDYPERPGSDAIRLQYYPGMTSVAELAVKSDSAGDITAAGFYRFNKWGYDVQVLSGILNSEDLVVGLGWSGSIKSVSFRGEMSYFHPYKSFSDTSGLFYLSMGLDYVFPNSVSLQCEALYSQLPKGFDITNFLEFYSRPLSVKNLSFTKFSIFAQAGFPVTPLLNLNLAGMVFPGLNGYYLGPSLTYSLGDNLEFSLYYQLFSGKFGKERQAFNLGFMRFKYNF